MNDQKKLILIQYATAHALVDLVCAASLFTLWYYWQPELPRAMLLFLFYNVLAFGLQAPLGLWVDKQNSPKQAAIFGCLLVAFGVLFISLSFLATIFFIGLGNALFHVGGGSVSLNLTPYKTIAPGIFVAPGALGLTLGILIGKGDAMFEWFFVLILLLVALILFKIELPKVEMKGVEKIKEIYIFFLLLFLLLIVVGVRALVSMSLSFSWKENVELLIILAAAISLGKAVGGMVAEKFGWIKTGLFGLIFSVPFLLFTANIPVLVIFAAFIFQFTMPITLVAIYKLLPDRPALAFGLPCLALLVGALPILLGSKIFINNIDLILLNVIIAVFSLYFALNILNKKQVTRIG